MGKKSKTLKKMEQLKKGDTMTVKVNGNKIKIKGGGKVKKED